MHHLRCRLVRGKASKGTNNAQLHSAIVLLVDSGRTTEQATWSLRCTSPILVTMSNSLPGSDRFTNQLPRLAHACSCCFCPALRQPLGGGGVVVPFQRGHLQLWRSLTGSVQNPLCYFSLSTSNTFPQEFFCFCFILPLFPRSLLQAAAGSQQPSTPLYIFPFQEFTL